MSLPKACILGAFVVAGVALPIWQQTHLELVRSENAQLRAESTQLRSQVTGASPSEVKPLGDVDADRVELDRLRQWKAQTESELLRLRGMAGVARRANIEADLLRAQLTQQEERAANNPMPKAMKETMNLVMEQRVDSQLARMTASLRLTPEQAAAARGILVRQAQVLSAGMQQGISGQFDKEEMLRLAKEAGNPDEQIQALLTPEQRGSFAEYKNEEAAFNARQATSAELIQLSGLGLTPEQEDRAFAALYEVTLNQLTGKAKTTPKSADQAEIMQWTLDQKAKALESVLTPDQFASYKQQQALQAKLAKEIWNKMQAPGSTPGSN